MGLSCSFERIIYRNDLTNSYSETFWPRPLTKGEQLIFLVNLQIKRPTLFDKMIFLNIRYATTLMAFVTISIVAVKIYFFQFVT